MIKLVAFDWNGTLFSDTFSCLEGTNEELKYLGLETVSLKTYQKYFDVPVKRMYLSLGVDEKVYNLNLNELAKIFHSFYEQRVLKVRTRRNTKKLLNWLLASNIDSIIFSNHIDFQISKQLERLKIEKYFKKVIANSHIGTSQEIRAKKDKLKNYIVNNKIPFKNILIVGDTIEEIEIGKELKVKTIAITGGNCSTNRLKAENPDYLIDNLIEIIPIVKELNNLSI